MSTSTRSTIVQCLSTSLIGVHAVGALVLSIVGHGVVRTVETEASNARVSLDPSSLLEASGKVVRNLAEDTNLALDNLLDGAVAHVTGDVADEALAGTLIPDTLPESARGVEVFRTDLAEEGDGFADEAAVDFVEVDGALAEGDRLNGAEVRRPGALVVEGHVAVTLEVGDAVRCTGGVDWKLLVVDSDTVTVGVGV